MLWRRYGTAGSSDATLRQRHNGSPVRSPVGSPVQNTTGGKLTKAQAAPVDGAPIYQVWLKFDRLVGFIT